MPSFSKSFPRFLKILHSQTLQTNQKNTTVRLISVSTIHLKQQHNVSFYIFKFIVKYILDVYINKIHARKCLYDKFILYGRFFPCFQFLGCIRRNPSHLISKQLGRKEFSMEQFPIDSGPFRFPTLVFAKCMRKYLNVFFFGDFTTS